MNYCIYNEVNSNIIAGLIISELPPIVKPRIRTETTEIEGKDGDIIETLGYASYDKSIQIGLFGNYDIDAIAKFFSGSGDLTFSNEPDKVYKAAIYEGIDFERLVKFRIAKVKFHVQPFKYLLGELPVELEITSKVGSEDSGITPNTNTEVNPTTESVTNTKTSSTDSSNNSLKPNADSRISYSVNAGTNSTDITNNNLKPNTDSETNPFASETSLTVNNVGLEKSKPIITLWGLGVVEISINTIGTFQLDFSINPDVPDEYLTVNSEIEECYKDTIRILKNRNMTGEFPILEVGANVITWTGTLTKIIVEVRSRWL